MEAGGEIDALDLAREIVEDITQFLKECGLLPEA